MGPWGHQTFGVAVKPHETVASPVLYPSELSAVMDATLGQWNGETWEGA